MSVLVGVRISGVTSVNRAAAIAFIQSACIMTERDIAYAFTIPGFNFISSEFQFLVLTGHPFTVTPINAVEDFYLNIAGNRIEVPYSKSLIGFNYRILEAGEMLTLSDVDATVTPEIRGFLENRQLFYIPIAAIAQGDFNLDFNIGIDFL